MRTWAAACALLAAGALAVGALGGGAGPGAFGHALAWDAWGWTARPWTLWTAAWVAPSAGLLGAHLLVLVALAVAGAALGAGSAAAAALLLAWPLATLGLALWPAVPGYAGLGGAVHAAAMVLWAHLVVSGRWRPLSFVLFAGIGLKLLAEQAWAFPVAFDPVWGLNGVPAAHLTGAAAGAALGLLLAAGEAAIRRTIR